MNSFEEVFEKVKNYCLSNNLIPAIGVRTWIEPLKPISFNGSDAVFTVGTEFQKNIVMTTYASVLGDAFMNVLGLKVNIVINVKSDNEGMIRPILSDAELDEKNDELDRKSVV